MSFDVVALPSADRDVDRILSWLHAASPRGAATWFHRWEQVVESLKQSADSCGRAPEDEDHDLAIQHLIFKTKRGARYRAIFTIRDRTVFILHVRGPGQDTLDTGSIESPPGS